MRNLSFKLVLACGLILLGAYLIVASGYDEVRGVTHKAPGVGGGRGWGRDQSYLYRIPVRREQNPDLFREFMTAHWIWALGIEGVGWILFIRNKQ
jgi:hypothetical protein